MNISLQRSSTQEIFLGSWSNLFFREAFQRIIRRIHQSHRLKEYTIQILIHRNLCNALHHFLQQHKVQTTIPIRMSFQWSLDYFTHNSLLKVFVQEQTIGQLQRINLRRSSRHPFFLKRKACTCIHIRCDLQAMSGIRFLTEKTTFASLHIYSLFIKR